MGLSGTVPAAGALGVDPNTQLQLRFDTPVESGSSTADPKYITLKRVSDNATVDEMECLQLIYYGGDTVTIPGGVLSGSTSYYVLVDERSFKSGDLWFAGIGDAAAWTFTTRSSSTQPPAVARLEPASGGILGALDGKLRMVFDKAVYAGTGAITIRSSSNQAVVASIAVTSDQVLGFGTNTLTINPGITFTEGGSYYVEIGNQALSDDNGNHYAGISGTAWSFTVSRDSTPPSLVLTQPSNGADGVSTLATFRAVFTEPIKTTPGSKFSSIAPVRRRPSRQQPALRAIMPIRFSLSRMLPCRATPAYMWR